MKEKFNYPTKVNKFATSQPVAVAAADSQDALGDHMEVGEVGGLKHNNEKLNSFNCVCVCV